MTKDGLYENKVELMHNIVIIANNTVLQTLKWLSLNLNCSIKKKW